MSPVSPLVEQSMANNHGKVDLMRIYIWNEVENLTTEYHSEGGLVIITDRLPKVALIASLVFESQWAVENLGPKYEALELPEPDYVAETDATEEKVFIFPNAGCC